jgi:hypothetical protein
VSIRDLIKRGATNHVIADWFPVSHDGNSTSAELYLKFVLESSRFDEEVDNNKNISTLQNSFLADENANIGDDLDENGGLKNSFGVLNMEDYEDEDANGEDDKKNKSASTSSPSSAAIIVATDSNSIVVEETNVGSPDGFLLVSTASNARTTATGAGQSNKE